jgi:probable DNA metabolism protein
MISTQTFSYILHCENSIDGILTALYDGFVLKKRLATPYNDCISIAIGENNTFELFAEWIEIKTNPEKASLTASTIHHQLGDDVYTAVLRSICTFDAERGTILMGFLVRAFAKGPHILNELTDSYVMKVMQLSRKTANEAHLFHGFVRFTEIGETLYSRIEPKCNVLPLISPHFANRFPNENWIIYDATHQLGSIHKSGGEWILMSDSALDIDLTYHYETDTYHNLWRIFFQTIAIKERENTKCQNTLLPKWYRKNMNEF